MHVKIFENFTSEKCDTLPSLLLSLTNYTSFVIMKWFRRIYAVWGILCFSIPLIFILPLFHIAAWKEKWHLLSSRLNHYWARLFFATWLIPYRVEYRAKLKPNEPRIYCANHTSWLDIPSLGLILKEDHVFMGKESLVKLPLFGPMFARLHITVNRHSHKDSYRALDLCRQAIDKGRSVILFPEGGINGEAPYLNNFKNGPFRLAIDKQVPIVPVTLLYNWKILDKTFLPRWHRGHLIVHAPLDTKGLNPSDEEELKKKTFDIIERDLRQHFPRLYENRSKYIEENSPSGTS